MSRAPNGKCGAASSRVPRGRVSSQRRARSSVPRHSTPPQDAGTDQQPGKRGGWFGHGSPGEGGSADREGTLGGRTAEVARAIPILHATTKDRRDV